MCCSLFFFLEDTITMHTISISICVIGKIKVHLISHPSLTPWFAAYELIRIHGDALEARFFERNNDVFFFFSDVKKRNFQASFQMIIYTINVNTLNCFPRYNFSFLTVCFIVFRIYLDIDRKKTFVLKRHLRILMKPERHPTAISSLI